MIKIYFTETKDFSLAKMEQRLKDLPLPLQQKILKYKSTRERILRVCGLLLLQELIRFFNLEHQVTLHQLQFSKEGKPYFKQLFYFNIAYSNTIVVCAATLEGAIGIDVEKIAPIELSLYQEYFTKQEWKTIYNGKGTYAAFYQYWTRKEAVIKAQGDGIAQDLTAFDVTADKIKLNNCFYYLKEVNLKEGYACHIASTFPDMPVEVAQLTVSII